MPRAADYLLDGHTYHLTHRCHDRRFLLRFARDRDAYREWVREGVKRFKVPVFGFCIVSNHVHLLVHADRVEDVSQIMHLAAGATGKQLNLRKNRTGAIWEHTYHCTAVEDGRHLLNCLVYIHLNMVRAGLVEHPADWAWSGHDELVGVRQRYRIVNVERLAASVGVDSLRALREWYSQTIDERIAARRLQRESHWTEALAVGSRRFVDRTKEHYTNRRFLDVQSVPATGQDVWAVREAAASYVTF